MQNNLKCPKCGKQRVFRGTTYFGDVCRCGYADELVPNVIMS